MAGLEADPYIRTFGTVVHLRKADVFPAVEARISRLYVEEGQRVSAGQALADLDRERLTISKAQVEAEVRSKTALLGLAEERLREGKKAAEARLIGIEKAQAEALQRQVEFANLSTVYENRKRLRQAGGVSDSELEATRTEFLGAQTALRQAELDLSIQRIGYRDEDLLAAGIRAPADAAGRTRVLIALNTRLQEAERRVAAAELSAAESELAQIELLLREATLRSPLDGVVAGRYLEEGEKSDPDNAVFTVLETTRVYVQVEASEADLASLRTGQEALLSAEGRPERRGTVALISPYINPQSRTARVRILVENQDGRFVPGMFARVSIRTGAGARRVVAPASALLDGSEGEAVAFVVRNKVVFRTEVKAGAVVPEGRVVESGLAEGDLLVLHASETLRDGMEVEP